MHSFKKWTFDIEQVDKNQYDKILSYIEHGKRQGATLLTGGKTHGEKGYYVEPTVFTDVAVNSFKTSICMWLNVIIDKHYCTCLMISCLTVLARLLGRHAYCKGWNFWASPVTHEVQVSSIILKFKTWTFS